MRKNLFSKDKNSQRLSYSNFSPTTYQLPQTSLEDHLRQAGSNIVTILTNPHRSSTINLEAGTEIQNALLQLANIFNTSEKIPSIPIIKESSSKIHHFRNKLL